MTIGTSIIRGSFVFTFTLSTLLPRGRSRRLRGGSKWSASSSRGLAIQKIEGLLVADSCPNSIEAPIPCQTSAYCLGRLFRLSGQRFQFLIQLFIADLHVLFLRDPFEQQRSFYIVNGLLALSHAQTRQIHFLHLLSGQTLRRQRAQSPLDPDVNLLFDQRIGNFKIVALNQFSHQFLFGLVLCLVLALGFGLLANRLPHIVHCLEFAQLLRELVIQFRQALLFDGLHLHRITERLPRQALVLGIFRIIHLERSLISGAGSAQVFGEFRHRVLACDFDEDFIHVNGLAFAGLFFARLRIAIERDLSEIAIGEGAAPHRIETGMPLAQIGQRFLHIFLGNRDLRLIGAQLFVALQLDFRQHLKGSFEPQRLALVQAQVRHPRLRYGMNAQPLSLLPEVARDQRLDHVGLDLFRKALANNRRRNMAAPEAGNTRYLLIFLDQRIGLPVDVRDGNLHLNLALGGAFLGRAVLGLSGTHSNLSKASAAAESEGKFSAARYAATLSVKTLEEQRQTAEGEVLPTKVTGECFVRRGFVWRGRPGPRKALQLMQPPAT